MYDFRYCIVFPETDSITPDVSYADMSFSVGEKIIIEDDPTVWIVKDIQHQFRKRYDTKTDTSRLCSIMTLIIVEELEGV